MRERKPTAPASRPATADAPVIPVQRLLGPGRQVRLEHDGGIYVLRITRNGKLILTK